MLTIDTRDIEEQLEAGGHRFYATPQKALYRHSDRHMSAIIMPFALSSSACFLLQRRVERATDDFAIRIKTAALLQ